MKPLSSSAVHDPSGALAALLDRFEQADTKVPDFLPPGWDASSEQVARWRASERAMVAEAIALLLLSGHAQGWRLVLTPPTEASASLKLASEAALAVEVVDVASDPVEVPPDVVVAIRHPVVRYARPVSAEVVSSCPPAPPPPPPAHPVDLVALKSHLEGRVAFGGKVELPAGQWAPRLAKVLVDLVEGSDPQLDAERVLTLVQRVDEWATIFPRDVQRVLLALVVARMRVLQDEVASGSLDWCYSHLSRFAKTYTPGFVYGLSRTHAPPPGGWACEVDRWRARAADLAALGVEPKGVSHSDLLARLRVAVADWKGRPEDAAIADAIGASLRKAVREIVAGGIAPHDGRIGELLDGVDRGVLSGRELRAVRDALAEDEAAEEAERAEGFALPEGWAYWPLVRGRRAVLVGGDPREPNRVRLERTFRFASLDWTACEFRRNGLVQIRDRVTSGGVDLVLLLRRFIGHDADQVVIPACRQAGVAWASVERGYGAVSIQRAIERYCDPVER